MLIKMQLRRGTTSEWGTANPVLDIGEPGYETNQKKLKIGDGVTAWNDLDYAVGGEGGSSIVMSSVAPSQPNEGDAWFDTVNERLYIRDADAWVEVVGGGGSGSVIHVSSLAPSAPSEGDGWFSTTLNTLSIWDGDTWVTVSGAGGSSGTVSVSTSETAPSNPVNGDMWFDSGTGKLLVYFDWYWVEPVSSPIIGPTGLSAYDLAVEHGFEGTETEWLASLQGEVGPAGLDSEVPGPPGEDGTNGSVIIAGTGQPQSNTTRPDGNEALEGDYFLDTNTAKLYGPRVAGGWPMENLELTYINLMGTSGKDGVSFAYSGDWQYNGASAYLVGDWVTYAGSLYVCNGNIVSAETPPPYDAGWDLALDPSNRRYGSGAIYTNEGPAANTVTASSISANYSRISPIYVPVGHQINYLLCFLTVADTVSGNTVKMGIYADNGNGYPGDLLGSGSFDPSGSNNTVREVDISAYGIVSSGLMWVAVKPETASSTVTFTALSPGSCQLVRGKYNPADSAQTKQFAFEANAYTCTATQNATGADGLVETFPEWGNSGVGWGSSNRGVKCGVVLA